jgi:hypothetical protein
MPIKADEIRQKATIVGPHCSRGCSGLDATAKRSAKEKTKELAKRAARQRNAG